MTYVNQQVYTGEWQNNKREGKGTLSSSDYDLSYFDGEWKDGQFKTGKCKQINFNGNTYEGELLDGKKHGDGIAHTITTADGKADDSWYHGQYVKDKKEGNGKLTMKNGSIYDGAWLHNEFNGFGTQTWVSGS